MLFSSACKDNILCGYRVASRRGGDIIAITITGGAEIDVEVEGLIPEPNLLWCRRFDWEICDLMGEATGQAESSVVVRKGVGGDGGDALL